MGQNNNFWFEPIFVYLHKKNFLFLGSLDELSGLGLVEAQRLLKKHVLAVVYHQHAHFKVVTVHSTNVDDVFEGEIFVKHSVKAEFA